MAQLKFFNPQTQQWELAVIGGQGAPGEGIPTGGTLGQILSKVDGTDYNTEWIDNYADWTSQVKHTVKAGESLTKGQAVYVSSANGTNMIVSKASNNSESTSSKTMGLIAQTMILNDQGFVITEGLLAGLNTASATAGDPVWLGTSGDLIYGLSNKPTAPAHLVFIGIVTRVHATNGEIFVKVQNGFELDELHDVSITSPVAGEVIVRNSANTLWENATLADAGISAVGHNHDDRYLTEVESGNAIAAAIANLVDSAPSTLDTLNELSAALNDDANFASTVTTALAGKSDTSHTHDDRYYTEAEMDSLLSEKSDTSHTHDDRYYTEAEMDSLLSEKSDTSHTHDDRYYTESEVNALIDTAVTNAVSTYIINAQAGTSYSIVASDKNKLVTMSNSSASTVTINTSTAFTVGQKVDIVQLGTGQVTFSGSGVTLNYTPGLKLRAQNSVASVICIATNTYLLVGDLTV